MMTSYDMNLKTRFQNFGTNVDTFAELLNAKYNGTYISLEVISLKIRTQNSMERFDENISSLHRESRKYLSLFQMPA